MAFVLAKTRRTIDFWVGICQKESGTLKLFFEGKNFRKEA